MYQLNFTIQTLAPVIISSKYGEINTINTESYIPGTTVLGMFAWRYLKNNSAKNSKDLDENFRLFFLDGNITFTNGWFTRKNEYDEETIYYPAPISFRKNKTEEKEIYDIFFIDDDFNEQTRPIESFISKEERKQTSPTLELHHHHERDRDTDSPADGQLFTYEAISSDQIFQGKLIGKVEDLQILLNICEKEWTGWLGRSRNSQYGKVKIRLDSPIKIDSSLDSLLNMENKKAVLTMLSHTIIYNQQGFPTTSINELEQHLCGAKIEKAAIKNKFIENFVGVWRFKKPSEIGFQAGSCFLLDIQNADQKKLAALQITGLGERTHEGFGQIRLENVLQESWPLYFLKYELKSQQERPEIALPDQVKSIVQNIVDNEIYNKVCCLAAEELIKFTNLPVGSLVARVERFLNSSKHDIAKFRHDIDGLKNIAKNQLEKCRTNNTTLKMFLMKSNDLIKIENIMSIEDMQPIQSICDEIDYTPEHDDDSLIYIYFETFLNLMKKRIKSVQKEN